MDITLEPKGLVNEDGLYFLQHQAIADMLKFVWSAILLPYLPYDYITSRIGLSGTLAAKLADVLDPLTNAYLEARANCKTFMDKLYPNIVDLSSYVYSYAQIAGGNMANSRYVAIIKWVKQVEAQDNSGEIVEYVLNNAFDRRKEDTHNASQRCTEIMDDLRGFEKQIGDSYDAITALGDALKGRITSDASIVDGLVSSIKIYRDGIRDALGKYEHDELLASRTPTYAWVSFFGTVSTSAARDVQGAYAQTLADLADAAQEVISNSGLEADLARLVADIHAITGDLQLLSNSICLAVDAVQGMQKQISLIYEDLRLLHDVMWSSPMQAIYIVSDLDADAMVRHWNGVKDAVDTYRQIAFGPAATTMTLDDLAALLRQHAATK